MYKIGLIGKPLDHSFSKDYFESKFKREKISTFSYNLYPIENLKQIRELIDSENLIGLNVTSPYKIDIIQYLDQLDDTAKRTCSVNTIFINKNKEKIGFNTDVIGFQKILQEINLTNIKALILGSGGVSKTVEYCLKNKEIEYIIVSRKPKKNMIHYTEIDELIEKSLLIINTTPVGQYPNTKRNPKIPYKLLSNRHCCIDLIYNPAMTRFLKKCQQKGAKIINGQKMFTRQAEASWGIWKKLVHNNV
tara:strand:- start:341 stop:1084 length:744 start_codon:yes stop_codon:yes gene_type:complete